METLKTKTHTEITESHKQLNQVENDNNNDQVEQLIESFGLDVHRFVEDHPVGSEVVQLIDGDSRITASTMDTKTEPGHAFIKELNWLLRDHNKTINTYSADQEVVVLQIEKPDQSDTEEDEAKIYIVNNVMGMSPAMKQRNETVVVTEEKHMEYEIHTAHKETSEDEAYLSAYKLLESAVEHDSAQ